MTCKTSNESGLRPAGHRVVVLPLETERKTESGIVLTDTFADREDMAQIVARVIAVGPSAWADQAKSGQWAQVGDKVLIAKFAGLYWKQGGKSYRVINDLDVVAVIEGEAE